MVTSLELSVAYGLYMLSSENMEAVLFCEHLYFFHAVPSLKTPNTYADAFGKTQDTMTRVRWSSQHVHQDQAEKPGAYD